MGLTYDQSEQVKAWHEHDVDGKVRSMTVIPDPNTSSDMLFIPEPWMNKVDWSIDKGFIRLEPYDVWDNMDMFVLLIALPSDDLIRNSSFRVQPQPFTKTDFGLGVLPDTLRSFG
jgi:hypothetical protein